MTNLTIEHVIENKLTPIQCVKFFKPDWTDEECDLYVWENTCFPFSSEVFIKQLNEDLSPTPTNR